MPQAYFTRSEERISLKKALATASAFFHGGDGGNRNRVRKGLPTAFYGRSLSFKIPSPERRQAGSPVR